ncbi:hypothetical protein FUAX_32570 [Fulvitalea axinellae]|uniref:Knr4/Smi1-like domain-containing protein n=1 Tax=Fulvitalea axinellae TaxID=1182444 RepID=A0AAU9DI73_9BACT|nr:hypothetical protein FUAX_32570 [Fulvitalea axinellae]
MEKYSEQIKRIKSKLPKAAKADPDLKVFGADSHNYSLGSPANAEDVMAFEKKYSVSLPDCFKAFILQVGNGGSGFQTSGAGPFYGIYPFDKGVGYLMYDDIEMYLKKDCTLWPGITDEDWEKISEKAESDDISDDEYEEEIGRIYGGILPIGSQGCTYLHGMVLAGKYRGKVVNMDMDFQKPRFTFEDNFLDWYERWLDEVISGDLICDTASWFGYTMGGPEEKLLETFRHSADKNTKIEALYGLLRKKQLSPSVLDTISQTMENAEGDIYRLSLQIIVKNKHPKWKSYLAEAGEKDLLATFKFIYWYDEPNISDWKEFTVSLMPRVTEPDTFRFLTYILQGCAFDYGKLIAGFIKNENEEIRSTAVYSLGKLMKKEDYLETFILGLNDRSNQVVHSSLQALSGVKNNKLLPHYENIALRFPVEKDYILTNLEYRLSEFGIDLKQLRKANQEKFRQNQINNQKR